MTDEQTATNETDEQDWTDPEEQAAEQEARAASLLPAQIQRAEEDGDWQTAAALKNKLLNKQFYNKPLTTPEPPSHDPAAEAERKAQEITDLQTQITKAEADGDWHKSMMLKNKIINLQFYNKRA